MENALKYSRKIFSNKFDLVNDKNENIGYLIFQRFNNNVTSNINNKNITFKKNGFWSKKFELYDNDENNKIAEIEFSNWKQKGFINFQNGEKYILSTKGFWNRKWVLDGESSGKITFNQRNIFSEEGEIYIENLNKDLSYLLSVIGLFIIYTLKRRAAIAAAG